MARLADAAIAYAAHGWRVLPLAWPITTGERPACCCSDGPTCRRIGKHPWGPLVERGLLDATTSDATIRRWWRDAPRANIGVLLGQPSGMWAIDIDPAAGGDRTLVRLVQQRGGFGPTLHAVTGSGGDHYFFHWPGVPVPTVAHRVGVGIDVRGDGGYIVAPPSLHHSGSHYEWEDPQASPARAPDWLLASLYPPPNQSPQPAYRGTVDIQRRATAYLAEFPPAIQGQDGSRQTFLAALHLVKGFGLSPDVALTLLEREYNSRCQPPWSRRELEHKVASAERSQATSGYLLHSSKTRT